MTGSFFKVLTPDLRDFHTGEFQYRLGGTHRPGTPPQPTYPVPSKYVLHGSATPEAAAQYGRWPYVLVEFHGIPVGVNGDKFGFRQITLPDELADVSRCFGPNGHAVVALLDELEGWSPKQWDAARDAAARDAAARTAGWDTVRYTWDAGDTAGYAAWNAAWYAARYAWDTAGYTARYIAGYAACALVVADLVGQYGLAQWHIDTLLAPIEAGRKAAR